MQSESHSHDSERTVLKLQAEVDRLQGLLSYIRTPDFCKSW